MPFLSAGHPLRLALSTLKATCLAHLAFTHLVQLSPASGPSMLPTFSVHGDWIAADMTARRGKGGSLRVGDLVLYKIPIFESQHGVKRLVGMPGDYVSLGTPGEQGEEQMIQVRCVALRCGCVALCFLKSLLLSLLLLLLVVLLPLLRGGGDRHSLMNVLSADSNIAAGPRGPLLDRRRQPPRLARLAPIRTPPARPRAGQDHRQDPALEREALDQKRFGTGLAPLFMTRPALTWPTPVPSSGACTSCHIISYPAIPHVPSYTR